MSSIPLRIWLRAFLVVFCAGLQFAGVSQSQERPGGQQVSPKAASDYPLEPLVYETMRGSMRYENDGTGVREVRARLHVQTSLGLQKAGQLIFDYNAANEKVEIRRVRVIRNDGTVVDAGPDAVQDLSAPVSREAPMYTDARQKHVTVPGLSIGDTIEYDVVTTTFKPLTPNQFWQTWNFIGDAICLDEQLDLNVPLDRPLKLKSPSDVEPTTRDEGDRRIYHWATSTLRYPGPADLVANFQSQFSVTKLLEGVQPPLPRQVLFSTFASWNEIGLWYESLERDRRIVTPEVRAKADEIIKGESSDLAKAQALYQWVSANIRYVSLSFGVGRYQPHEAAEILSNRYGDCKDKATLLKTMFEAEGLHADTVLINSKSDVDSAVPSPLQFDHAIVFLPLEGRSIWLDPTIGAGPFAYLLPQLRGKNALVVSPDSISSLRQTPSDLAIPTIYRLEVQSGGDDHGGRHSMKLRIETRGDLEVLFRLGLMQMPSDQLLALMNRGARSASGGKNSDVSIDSLKASDPTDTRSPFSVEAQVSATDEGAPGHESPQQAALSLAKELELAQLAGFVLPEGSAAPSTQPGSSVSQPVEVKGPEEFSLTIVYTATSPPTGKSAVPVHTHIVKDFATFDNEMAWNGLSFSGRWRLTISASQIPGNELAEYKDFRRNVLASLGTQNVIDPLVQYLANNPQDGNGYLRLGDAYLSSHEFEKAVPNLETATKLLPGNESALLSLARAYLDVGKEEKAIGAFERMISMDDSSSTLNNAAYYLGEQKTHMDLAEKWAKGAIKSVEDDLNQSNLGSLQKRSAQLTGGLAAYWDTFGWIKFHEGDYGAAEKYVRAAWEIANYTDVGSHLGLIYQAMGRKDDAIEAYVQTLALVPTSQPPSENEIEARRQLRLLLGDDSLVQGKVQEARSKSGSWRSIHIDNPAMISGSGRFILIIGPDSRIEDIRPLQRNNPVNDLESDVRAATMPQTFPDSTLQKLPRAGTLSCTTPPQSCTFMLMPPVPAAQVFASLAGGSTK